MVEEKNEENKIFIEQFHVKQNGFFDLTSLTDVGIGFVAKKMLKPNDHKNFSSIEIYIPKTIYNEKTTKKLLTINAIYGKKTEYGGITLRLNPRLDEPIDLSFADEYYYDISTKEFFKRNKKIEASKIINEVYEKHIQSTKPVRGFLVRNKIRFYRVFLYTLFKYLAITFSSLLKLISGEIYEYSFSDHINYKINPEIEKNKVKEEKAKEISFLGYKATPECIMFYSIFHFIFFGASYYYDKKPDFLVKIFNNPFLTLIYVMLSLIIIDKKLPIILKGLINIFSKLSFNFLYKTIKV